VLEANAHKYLTPRACMLPDDLKLYLGSIAMKKIADAGQPMTNTELLAAHREEQPALDKMLGALCRGCNMSKCKHFVPREARGRRHRRR